MGLLQPGRGAAQDGSDPAQATPLAPSLGGMATLGGAVELWAAPAARVPRSACTNGVAPVRARL
eukprot:4555873-Prymnesium_polylepis.2